MSSILIEKQLFTDIKVIDFQHQLNDGTSILFGVNAYKVKEVIVFSELSSLSSDYLPFVGVLDYRGTPVPVIDLSSVVPNSYPGTVYTRIIIIESMGRLTGLLTQSQLRMIEFQNDDFKAPTFSSREDASHYVSGFFKLPNDIRYVHLIDIESIISPHLNENLIDQNQIVSRGKKVLVVEDSMLFQKKIVKLMRDLGFDVTIANDGAEGIEKLNEAKFDLVFTDIEMPKMNGIEMARKIKKSGIYGDVPLIFHSSLTTPSMIALIEEEKLGDYLTKFEAPLILAKLLEIFPKV